MSSLLQTLLVCNFVEIITTPVRFQQCRKATHDLEFHTNCTGHTYEQGRNKGSCSLILNGTSFVRYIN